MEIKEKNFFPPDKKIPSPAEKLKREKFKIWEKVKNIFTGLDFDFNTEAGKEKEAEIAERIKSIETMEKGGEYENEEGGLFFETGIKYRGKPAVFKTVAQSDPEYNFEYKIDYAKEMPDWQKHAERILKREAIIGQKLGRFTSGREISADSIKRAETRAGQDMYLLKTTKESSREAGAFGRQEGRELAKTLLALQYDVDATAMVQEIMSEQGYKSQYALENEFSEDIFNDFNGYKDNSEAILSDLLEDGELSKARTEAIGREMEKYRTIIESRQMGADEYCLAHNECYLDKLVAGEDGEIYLSDWKNVGTTQNRELALTNDLGQAFESAREHLGGDNAEAFIQGAEEEIKAFYEKRFGDKGGQIAEAVIRLTRLRSFREI